MGGKYKNVATICAAKFRRAQVFLQVSAQTSATRCGDHLCATPHLYPSRQITQCMNTVRQHLFELTLGIHPTNHTLWCQSNTMVESVDNMGYTGAMDNILGCNRTGCNHCPASHFHNTRGISSYNTLVRFHNRSCREPFPFHHRLYI